MPLLKTGKILPQKRRFLAVDIPSPTTRSTFSSPGKGLPIRHMA
jgi:hypothetical protein